MYCDSILNNCSLCCAWCTVCTLYTVQCTCVQSTCAICVNIDTVYLQGHAGIEKKSGKLKFLMIICSHGDKVILVCHIYWDKSSILTSNPSSLTS